VVCTAAIFHVLLLVQRRGSAASTGDLPYRCAQSVHLRISRHDRRLRGCCAFRTVTSLYNQPSGYGYQSVEHVRALMQPRQEFLSAFIASIRQRRDRRPASPVVRTGFGLLPGRKVLDWIRISQFFLHLWQRGSPPLPAQANCSPFRLLHAAVRALAASQPSCAVLADSSTATDPEPSPVDNPATLRRYVRPVVPDSTSGSDAGAAASTA